MVTYYVEMSEISVSILSDEVGKPFSVRPAADNDLILRILRIWEISPKFLKCLDLMASTQPAIRKTNFYICAGKS